jgi:hypothetical protein
MLVRLNGDTLAVALVRNCATPRLLMAERMLAMSVLKGPVCRSTATVVVAPGYCWATLGEPYCGSKKLSCTSPGYCCPLIVCSEPRPVSM